MQAVGIVWTNGVLLYFLQVGLRMKLPSVDVDKTIAEFSKLGQDCDILDTITAFANLGQEKTTVEAESDVKARTETVSETNKKNSQISTKKKDS